jgi:UDP-N-acetylmuramate: L-alanyl-gamma-D-glutamyl-meso-diaminopimelate ligase
MHVHFVAVAGTGMGALAGLFKAAGHDVSGSDVAFYPPMGPALERWGIRLMTGFDPAHLAPRPDLVVIGNVCRASNPEARAAIDGGMTVTTMAHALADHMLRGRSPLVVGGTHGKTTTSALCAWLLHEAGRDPGFLIGGLPKNFDTSFRLPRSSPESEDRRGLPLLGASGTALRRTPFVVEGDEYDTAFFEKTPKFWHYRPEVAIVTSIEHDHVDIYPDAASYEAAFRGFIERVPETGLVIAAAHDPRVVEVVNRSARAQVAWFALEGDDTHGQPPHWLAAPAEVGATGQSFDVYAGGVMAGRAATRMPGHHNVRNAIAAIAAAAQGFGVPITTAFAALASFDGVRRRQDLLFEARGVRVYDDFAHHPTAIRTTLDGLRRKLEKEQAAGGTAIEPRILAVFEPRSNTMKLGTMKAQLPWALEAADLSFALQGPWGWSVADALAPLGRAARVADSVPALVGAIVAAARPGDHIVVMSNGGFGGIHGQLLQALAGQAEHGA